ncbi:hypothetical protein R0G64_31610, partial [Pseudomonas otitidis]
INAQPLSAYQWRVVLLCFLIVFLDGLDTAAMGFIAPAMPRLKPQNMLVTSSDLRRSGVYSESSVVALGIAA